MSSNRPAVLIVDDERSVTDLLSEDLTEEGYNCLTAFTGEDALERLSRDNVDIALVDLKLPGISGMDVLREAKSMQPGIVVIVVTASGDAQTAVEAMKIGAVDYITKPFELKRVNESVETALQARGESGIKTAMKTGVAKTTSVGVDWMHCLDSIAEGVETRLDSLTGHVMSIAVIEQTIDVARKMEIPQGQVDKWADTRRSRFERIRVLDSLLAMEPIPNS